MAQSIRIVGSGAFFYSSDFPHEVNNEICKHEIAAFLDNAEIATPDSRKA